MKKLTIAVLGISLMAALAGTCGGGGTNGVECFQPGQIRVEHRSPSITETFKCVLNADGKHAHWVKVPNDCKGAPTSGPELCAG